METILVVDDIETNRKLLKQALIVLKGYNVIEAANGAEAVAQFEKERPDLILMDINMPDMDGREATTAIKAVMGDDYTPIIFVTALSAETSLAGALASGGDDFISKPFDIKVLESKINAHLRIRVLNQQINEKNRQLVSHNQYLSHEQDLVEHFFESALENSYLDERFIKYHMSSMSTFNGDMFLVERSPKGGLYIIMGDFTGHGLSAAMGTLPVAMIFFKMVSKGFAIEELASEINLQLNKLLPPSMFLAATLLELDEKGEKLSVWMGGMPQCYWLGKNGELKEEIHSKNLSLGILSETEFNSTTQKFDVEKGDKVYLYSDGVTEAGREDGEMFGDERLKNALTTNGDDRLEQVLKELKLFTGVVDQGDDITLVEMTCLEMPEL